MFTQGHQSALEKQRARASALSETRACPECGHTISLLDALCMVRGHGWRYFVNMTAPDGHRVSVREPDFNPQTMLWWEP